MLTFFDVCSGIGGGRLGLEAAGLKCVGYCDTSRLVNKTYNLIFDTSDDFFIDNLRKINAVNVPKYDLLIAGFPCQTFSVIGRKDGFEDKRGQIIFDLAHILSISNPPFFVFENVKGLVTHDKGQTLKTIIKLLENCGYHVDYKVLSTLNYGVPQNRQRVYFIGIRNDLFKREFEWPSETNAEPISSYFLYEKEISDVNLSYFKRYLENDSNKNKYSFEELLKCQNVILDTRMNDLRIYTNKMPTLRSQRDGIYYIYDKHIFQLTGKEALLFQGFPLKIANIVSEHVSDRHILMQAGNAMSVNVIKALGQSINQYYSYIKNKEDKNMTTWEEFEINSTNYLNQNFGGIATFKHQGGSDSTIPDILVSNKKGENYYIEAKHCPAQCGQFVLLPNIKTSSFDYSKKNINKINSYAKAIMEFMNRDFESFKEAGTAGKDIAFPNDQIVFSNWIKSIYKEKGVKFIITNNFRVIKLEDFEKAFKISTKYRIKRSGSSSVGNGNICKVSKYLKENFVITNLEICDDKIFVTSSIELHNNRFVIDGYEYMISKRDSKYEIRKLSNTFNANVIFSIESKTGCTYLDDTQLKSLL